MESPFEDNSPIGRRNLPSGKKKKKARFADDVPSGNTHHENVAVILLDFQNEFATEGGKLHDDVKIMMASNGMIKKVTKFLGVARNSGAKIIYSPVIMQKKDKFADEENDVHSYGAMEGLFTEGTWNAEIIDQVKPESHDHILKNRVNFSAFQGTDLESTLKDNGITTVFLSGFLTNVCIEETAREMSLVCPEIDAYVLSDGSACKSKEEHDHSTTVILPMFDAKCLTCAEALSILSSSKPVTKKAVELNKDGSFRIPKRTRILALAGAKSNGAITKLQLKNLRITEEFCDIDYLEGQIQVEEGDPELIGLAHGPFYSWLDPNEVEGGRSLIEAVIRVLTAVHIHGPYDGIYGFSTGGIVASCAADIAHDKALQEVIASLQGGPIAGILGMSAKMSIIGSSMRKSMANMSTKMSLRSSALRKSSKAVSSSGDERLRQKRDVKLFNQRLPRVTNYDFSESPFKFVVLACSGSKTSSIPSLRELAGIGNRKYADIAGANTEKGNVQMKTKSFHLVGIEDELKGKSEEIFSLYDDPHVMYLPGGHGISSIQRTDDKLCYELKQFIRTRGNPPPKAIIDINISVSEVTSIGPDPHYQIAEVELKNDLLPQGLYASNGGATIKAVLQAQSAVKPLLYDARSTNSSSCTTYGDLLNFIEGGDGDLRHLGVRLGEVVAYGAPPGGGAVAAAAFLCIGAQTTAAPLAPGMMEPDAEDALDQFDAKHLILFEGIDNPGIEAAFLKRAASGKAKLHRASIIGDSQPGLFKYITVVSKQVFNECSVLSNPAKGPCLLLRTSGTTARPKGVPLPQGSLITNGAIIAKSMQLQESDVCYSVMPLFHIGGISASILCTLASGGSICCDGEPFDPSRMVDALALSKPQPTWYSSVPTIHNATVNFLKDVASSDPKYMAYGVNMDGVWKTGHSLRMIRSGAAALLGPDGDALRAAYGKVAIYPTYSMSEQMPISQPPAGKVDTLRTKPGSVGVPVAASTVIVNRSTLRPQAYGEEGEIAISGPTVLEQYLNNPSADMKNYFFATSPTGDGIVEAKRYFLTGDIGMLDHEGFLSLKGRAKELIKKGGEQVSPYEVEEPLLDHPWVQTAVCFAVRSKMYGEEVGCAIILSPKAPENLEIRELTKVLRNWLRDAQLAPVKWPTKLKICTDDELPKTKTKKYIRIGMADALGLEPQDGNGDASPVKEKKALVDWGVLGGFRFFLACYVMFMHIGSVDSWGSFSNLRGFPWHVHVFFTLGGYSMASPMNPAIKKKLSYFIARIGAMYPMYAAALFFGLVNLLIVCRPSTFRPFHWDSQPDDLLLNGELAPLFCEGTPATPNSYWGSLILTVLTYIFGLAVTPFWPISWWMGYYLWFSSMYYFCLAIFPATYNLLYNRMRKQTSALLKLIVILFIVNYAILATAWFSMKNGSAYNHYDTDTGEKNNIEDREDGKWTNIAALSFYLFGPFWALYFFIGTVTAFLYDAYCPNERHNAHIWGWIADTVTLIMLGLMIAVICQGTQEKGAEVTLPKYMRPYDADEFTDISVINRLWDNVAGRLACPLTTIWVFALSTGEGYTAGILRNETLSVTLAPNAYNCFLFHQMIGQWYFAATRNGHFWNWWRYRKTHYWFSPEACPVEWYEYPLVVGLVVVFSRFMDSTVQPMISAGFSAIMACIKGEEEEEDVDTSDVLLGIIENMTGIQPELDYTLDECGLASIGIPVLVALLNKNFSTSSLTLDITPADLIAAKTIVDMVNVVDECKARADAQGV